MSKDSKVETAEEALARTAPPPSGAEAYARWLEHMQRTRTRHAAITRRHRPDDLLRPIVGTAVGDDELEAVRLIVLREHRTEALRDEIGLIADRHDHGDGGYLHGGHDCREKTNSGVMTCE